MRVHRFIRRGLVPLVAALCGVVLAVTPGGCSGSGAVGVRPDYDGERTTTYELSLVTQVNHAVMLTGEKATRDELTLRFRAETIERMPGGGAVVTLAVERLRYLHYGSDRIIEFDSAQDDSQNKPEGIARLFRAASGAAVQLEMTPEGLATYRAGLESVEALTATREDRGRLRTVFLRGWWEDLGESVYRLGCDAGRVRVGDSWQQGWHAAEQGYMTLSGLLEREVVSATRDRVEVEESGGFTVDFSRDAFTQEEPTSVDQQDISGRVVWDLAHGRLLESDREVVLQLSQSWQGIAVAKRHAVVTKIRRVGGDSSADPVAAP
ncbi:MAG: hypothetical protein H6813_03935 [Phycisphaeraceae bacterium]|nr:hypothetical protein [Phycisphaeraceae bacterium]MCB9847096.1 hypothetical protein [Phycisphaeraceae bacterium]